MLEITIEYRHGILFVRLGGMLTKKTYSLLQDTVTDIIEKGGITYLVFNLEHLTQIDDTGINCLISNYNLVNQNKGLSMICGIKDNLKQILNQNKIFNFFHKISDELSAMKVIEWNS